MGKKQKEKKIIPNLVFKDKKWCGLHMLLKLISNRQDSDDCRQEDVYIYVVECRDVYREMNLQKVVVIQLYVKSKVRPTIPANMRANVTLSLYFMIFLLILEVSTQVT